MNFECKNISWWLHPGFQSKEIVYYFQLDRRFKWILDSLIPCNIRCKCSIFWQINSIKVILTNKRSIPRMEMKLFSKRFLQRVADEVLGVGLGVARWLGLRRAASTYPDNRSPTSTRLNTNIAAGLMVDIMLWNTMADIDLDADPTTDRIVTKYCDFISKLIRNVRLERLF